MNRKARREAIRLKQEAGFGNSKTFEMLQEVKVALPGDRPGILCENCNTIICSISGAREGYQMIGWFNSQMTKHINDKHGGVGAGVIFAYGIRRAAVTTW